MTDRPVPLRERAYVCWEQGCRRTWFDTLPAATLNCPYCGSTLISHEVRP